MLPIVHADEHLLVLDKPSGLLAVPGKGPDLQDCLSARVQAVYPGALVVHRLDRDTSGLIVMALSLDAQRALGRQFEARTVEKSYVAVVHGLPSEDRGVINLPMRKDFDHPPRHRIDRVHGRPAQTEWQVVESGDDLQEGGLHDDRSRVELHPITGRSHQLRLHLASIGHPILGDPLYAPAEALAMAPRLLLHAERLTLDHPRTGERVTWRSACPF
jgi:tRNA pseudouridine32 synthase/23S rRNA pseudouridine746 synthase